MKILALTAACAALWSAAAAQPQAPPAVGLPAGVYEVVTVRRASDTASTLATQADDALGRSIGRRISFGETIRWYDDRVCGAGRIAGAAGSAVNVDDPNLSDLQVAPGSGDRRVNRSLIVDCGGRALSSIAQIVQVDGRVLVERIANGTAYVVMEAPLDPVTARRVEAGLAGAGLDPGPVDGVIDDAARRAVALYAQRQGAAFAFDRGVITDNLLASLTADYDLTRALANWRANNAGKSMAEFSPTEHDELMALLADMRRSTPVGASAECRAAWSRAERAELTASDEIAAYCR